MWANAWDVFHLTPSRGGRGRRAAVNFVVCFGVRRGFSLFFFFRFFFFFERERPATSMRPPCLIYLSSGTTAAAAAVGISVVSYVFTFLQQLPGTRYTLALYTTPTICEFLYQVPGMYIKYYAGTTASSTSVQHNAAAALDPSLIKDLDLNDLQLVGDLSMIYMYVCRLDTRRAYANAKSSID